MNISDDDPTKNIPEKQEPPAQLEENIMDGKNFEDIDSPDEVTLIQCLRLGNREHQDIVHVHS